MKIKVNGKIYIVRRKVYDPFIEGHLYYLSEYDEPICDLNNKVEEIHDD